MEWNLVLVNNFAFLKVISSESSVPDKEHCNVANSSNTLCPKSKYKVYCTCELRVWFVLLINREKSRAVLNE